MSRLNGKCTVLRIGIALKLGALVQHEPGYAVFPTATTAGVKVQPTHSGNDHAEFESQYRRYAGAVYAVAQHLCGVRVAGDITREVFLDLWWHREDYLHADASMRARLLGSTCRLAADPTRATSGDAPDPVHSGCAPTGERRDVERVLAELCDDERVAILLVTKGGCTSREAAAALGLDNGTINRTIRAGLQHLNCV